MGFSGQVVGQLVRRRLESSVSVRGENKESVMLCRRRHGGCTCARRAANDVHFYSDKVSKCFGS